MVHGIVLAAGSGERFGGRKQFERLGDERLVDRVVASAAAVCHAPLLLVLPNGAVWDGAPVGKILAGADSRLGSLRNAMSGLPEDAEHVLVAATSHPLARTRIYGDVVAAVLAGADGAVPVIPSVETIKRRVDGTLETVGRDGLVLTQAPFAFRVETLREALARPDAASVSDESVLVERSGGHVVAVEGDVANLHVTTPTELAMARGLVDAGLV